MTDDTLPEADRVDGAPHPRETQKIFGQDPAQSAFLTAFNTGRLHHGWLLTGPRGVGKATLAWKIARFLLATPKDQGDSLFGAPPAPTDLGIPDEHPVARRISAGSEPGLFPVRRAYDEKKKRLKTQITVDEIRKLKNFFALSAADGGRRVAIVDSADEMNVSAANALLKVLEEPPEDAILLLISHQPSRLLPTIRSRCRELRLQNLTEDNMHAALRQAEVDSAASAAMAELSGGSVGEAIRLSQLEGLSLYAEIVQLFQNLPQLDRQRALKLAELAAVRGAEDRFDLLLNLFDLFLVRLARAIATGKLPMIEAAAGEAAAFSKLAQSGGGARIWAEVAQEISDRSRHGRSVNLDPAALVLDMVWKIQSTAEQGT